MASALIQQTPNGLYCEAGDFYIDPQKKVSRAVITHAHSDHAKPGSNAYLCSHACLPLLRHRIGTKATIEALAYGKMLNINGVSVSLHPAGHILGSAQVRLEHRGRVWVVTGDYKLQPDPTCAPFEPVCCETLVSECTFGLPIYRWDNSELIAREIND